MILAAVGTAYAADPAATAKPEAGKVGTVNCYRLNVRVKPGNHTVVGTLKRGDKVHILEEKDGWYRISIQEDSQVWVSERFVKDGKLVSDVNLRSGPGINFRAYGIAKGNQPVQVIDKSKKDWLRIKPLSDMSAWVSKTLITIDGGSTDTAAAVAAVDKTAKEVAAQSDKTTKPVKADPKSPVKDLPQELPGNTSAGNKAAEKDKAATEKPATKPVKPIAAKSDKEDPLPFIDEPAEEVQKEGLLLSLTNGAVMVTHAICVKESNGTYRTLGFLYGDANKMNSLLEKKVRLKGSQRWVKGWKFPVIKVNEIDEIKK